MGSSRGARVIHSSPPASRLGRGGFLAPLGGGIHEGGWHPQPARLLAAGVQLTPVHHWETPAAAGEKRHTAGNLNLCSGSQGGASQEGEEPCFPNQ